MTLQLISSEYPYIGGKLYLFFYKCTVPLRSISDMQENQLDAMNESLILADIKAEEKEKLFRYILVIYSNGAAT